MRYFQVWSEILSKQQCSRHNVQTYLSSDWLLRFLIICSIFGQSSDWLVATVISHYYLLNYCSKLWLANVISHYYLLNFRSKLWLASGYCDFSLLFAQFSFKALIGYCDFSLLFAQFLVVKKIKLSFANVKSYINSVLFLWHLQVSRWHDPSLFWKVARGCVN